jgi:septation ring formation regulator EzrA
LRKSLEEIPKCLVDLRKSLEEIPKCLVDLRESLEEIPKCLVDLRESLEEIPKCLMDLRESLEYFLENPHGFSGSCLISAAPLARHTSKPRRIVPSPLG